MQFVIHVNTVITNGKGQILLVREKKAGAFNKLNFPGGHLEPGEELIECAKREAKEEISAEISVEGLIGVFSSKGKDHYLNFIFKGRIVKGEAEANTDHVKAIEWRTSAELEEIPDGEILNPGKFREIIEKYQVGVVTEVAIIKELL